MDNTKPLSLLVREIRHEADGVVSVCFVDPTGADLPPFNAGAHLEIALPSGLIRQYSLWSNPDDPQHYRVGVLREDAGRGGSKEIHDTGLVGKTLTVNGPRNRFDLVDAKKYIFIAGGIGVTPLVPMLSRVARKETAPTWSFHYGGRSRKSMAFTGVIERLAQSAGGNGTVNFMAEDDNGILDLRGILSAADADTAIYCCGPGGLISAVEKLCEEMNLPGLHVERFGAAPVDTSIVSEANSSFEVELAKSGTTVTVTPDASILECIRPIVPGVPASCEEGFCGTCEVRMLAGTADHRDQILTKSEQEANDTIFICVSRAKSPRIVLDI